MRFTKGFGGGFGGWFTNEVHKIGSQKKKVVENFYSFVQLDTFSRKYCKLIKPLLK